MATVLISKSRTASFLPPLLVLERSSRKVIEDLDKPLLEALNARGLRTWRGQRGTGSARG
ncbi:hypothetical protein V1522DRAFT_417448 [Lipomyces starkeyi]